MDHEDESVRETLESAVVETLEPVQQETVVEVTAPDTWSEEDKKRFGSIADPETRKWLLGRDETYTKEIGGYKEKYGEFDQIFEPYKERLATTGQKPSSVVNNLLRAQMALETQPREAMLWLAKNYNIDLASLVGGGGKAAEVDENGDPLAELDPKLADFLKGLETQVKQVTTRFATEDERAQQNAAQTLSNTMTEFRQAKDDQGASLYPHLSNEAVTKRMATLIRTGEVEIVGGDVKAALNRAYDEAVYSVPSVRAELLKKQEGETSQRRLLKAKRAGVGVTGVGSSAASQPSTGSVREMLSEQFREKGML